MRHRELNKSWQKRSVTLRTGFRVIVLGTVQLSGITQVQILGAINVYFHLLLFSSPSYIPVHPKSLKVPFVWNYLALRERDLIILAICIIYMLILSHIVQIGSLKLNITEYFHSHLHCLNSCFVKRLSHMVAASFASPQPCCVLQKCLIILKNKKCFFQNISCTSQCIIFFLSVLQYIYN